MKIRKIVISTSVGPKIIEGTAVEIRNNQNNKEIEDLLDRKLNVCSIMLIRCILWLKYIRR